MSREFLDTLRAHGLEPPSDIEPGKLYRFPGLDKRRGNTAGWCKLFPDGLGGVFGDFSRDFSETWQAKKPYTPEKREAFRRQVEEEQHQREKERQAVQRKARETAKLSWNAAQLETGEHRYLRTKGIKPYGIHSNGESLLIPLWEADGRLQSVQFISPLGEKRFLGGGRIKGGYHAIGKPNGRLYICEGYATGASVHEATGEAVAVAFDCGNLLPVAEALRRKYPNLTLVTAADNDAFTAGNPGVTNRLSAYPNRD
jgi:putative DNA primase/helicase